MAATASVTIPNTGAIALSPSTIYPIVVAMPLNTGANIVTTGSIICKIVSAMAIKESLILPIVASILSDTEA